MALKSGLAAYAQLNKKINSSKEDSIRSLQGKFISAKVVSINQLGGGNDGVIECVLLDNVIFNNQESIGGILPLFPNIKNYPLINEVVLIIALADKEYQSDYNRLNFYYLNPLNLWNSQQVNPIPFPNETILPNTTSKGYLEVETINSPNKPSSGSNTNFKVGTYFNEKGNINPLYSYEGDFILDGRFGNSFRLGNTVPNSKAPIKNNWSIIGDIGDPITIISNGHASQIPSYNSITENINSDKSSAYFTSTQQIPIEVSSTNDYLSYDKGLNQTSPVTSIIKKEKRINFPSGDSGQTVNIQNQITEILLLTTQDSTVEIVGSESQVPNPNGIARGELASLRAKAVKQFFPEVNNIITSTQIGNTSFISGIDNPNDPQYTSEQFVDILLTQRIDREVTSSLKNKPTLPNQYSGEQVILNSGRLLFNSSKDHILLSSAKSINLNAIESINFDTTGPIVMEGSEVYLGSSAAFESAVLGDTLIDLLQGITSNLATSLNTAAAQLGNNDVPLEPLGSAFRAAANSLNTYGNQLDQAKSNIVKLQ